MNLLHNLQRDVKFQVVVADLAMTIYCLWLILTNSSSNIVGYIFGFSPFGAWMLYKASAFFKLCVLHKSMIIHSMAVYCCMAYHAEVGFGGSILLPARVLMFSLGAINFICLFKKQVVKYNRFRNINGHKG